MAGLLDVTISGTGELGEITTASVASSGVASNIVDDGIPSVGAISVTGRTKPTSKMLMDNTVSIDDMSGLGKTSGVVDTVSVTKATTVINAPDDRSRFVTGNIAIPTVLSGSPVGALDLAMQLTGEVRGSNHYTQGDSDHTVIFTMNGHDAGFANGKMVRITNVHSAGYTNRNPMAWGIRSAALAPAPPVLTTPGVVSGQMYSRQSVGGTNTLGFLSLDDQARKSVWSFYYPATLSTIETTRLYIGSRSQGNYVTFVFNAAADTITVSLTITSNSSLNRTFTLNTSTLTTSEFVISTTWMWNRSTGAFTLAVSAIDTTGLHKVTNTFTSTVFPDYPVLNYYDGSMSLPTMRMVRIDKIPNAWTGWDVPYEIASNVLASTPNTVGVTPIQYYNGQVWGYLSQVCAATGNEIAVSNNRMVMRPMGGRPVDISNAKDYPSLTFSTQKAEAVTLQWSEYIPQSATASHLQFNATEVYSVDATQTNTITVQTTNSYSWIVQPQVNTVQSMLPPANILGYAVSGADNKPVVPSQWIAYGGSLTVSVTDVEGELSITLVGPRTEIPGVKGPYKIAASDDQNDYPLLRVAFYGSAFQPVANTTSRTGAAPSPVTQIEPVMFTNVCATNWKTVWPIIASAAKRYAGSTPSLSVTIPTRDALGFGLCEGSVFTFDNSTYRVTNVSYNFGTTQVTAQQHVTYGDVQAAWAGSTYAEVAAFWSADAYTYQDASIAPLTTEW